MTPEEAAEDLRDWLASGEPRMDGTLSVHVPKSDVRPGTTHLSLPPPFLARLRIVLGALER